MSAFVDHRSLSQILRSLVLILVPVLAACLTTGCTRSVEITHPVDNTVAGDPVPTITVKFHPEFQPGTFQANLSGTNITGLFQPTPAPGGVSTAQVAFPNFMDFNYDNNRQYLVVDAEFTTPTNGLGNRLTRDSSRFTPAVVNIYHGKTSFERDLSVKEGQTIEATAFIQKAPKERLLVTITGHSMISLNNQPAGQPIQVWIEPNDRRAVFNIRGIQVAGESFTIRPIATGYSSQSSGGFVGH